MADQINEAPKIPQICSQLWMNISADLMAKVSEDKPSADTPQNPEARSIKDPAGNEFAIQYRDGKPVYQKDLSGEWESTDGKVWTKKGGSEVKRGTVSFDEKGRFTWSDAISGVVTKHDADGGSEESFLDNKKNCFRVAYDKHHRMVELKDATGEWTSHEGNIFRNDKGDVKTGEALITRHGEYIYRSKDNDSVTRAVSSEHEYVLQKRKEILQKHGIDLVLPGQSTQTEAGRDEVTLFSGLPSREELDCLEKALDKSQHFDYKGLQVWFIDKMDGVPKIAGLSLTGYYNRSRADSPAALVLSKRHKVTDGFDELEGLILHELVHHEHYTSLGGTYKWGTPAGTAESKALMNKLGWQFDDRLGYLLKDNKDGLWQRGPNKTWIPVIAGNPEPARAVPNAEMRKQALVTPVSNYFPYPAEQHAEAMAMYRIDPEKLFRESPKLYELASEEDKKHLTKRFGTAADGTTPLKLRAVNGQIVENSAEERQKIERAKQKWSTTTPPEQHGRLSRERQMYCDCCV